MNGGTKRMSKRDIDGALHYLRYTFGLYVRATQDTRPGRFEVLWGDGNVEEMSKRDVWMLARGARIGSKENA
jgi:hypothetical protein